MKFYGALDKGYRAKWSHYTILYNQKQGFTMQKRHIAIAALALTSLSASAADYYVVTPVLGKTVAIADVAVTLNSASIPDATLGTPYSSFDFKSVLSVTGDPALDASKASFSSTALPAGLTLSQNGVLSGTPTELNRNGSPFDVVAQYKNKSGGNTYTLKVHGALLSNITQLVKGNYHACALVNGGVKCWGWNNEGALGNGGSTDAYWLQPQPVVGLSSGVVALTAGGTHTCAVLATGEAKCWGANQNGQLGDGTTTSQLTPVTVANLPAVSGISAGAWHTCAITTTGAAKCWGHGDSGRLGNGATTSQTQPVSVSGLSSGVSQISAGLFHTCAVMTSGEAKCWGANMNGQVGADTTQAAYTTPVTVWGLSTGTASISAGVFHSCAVTKTGAAKCWGYNGQGELGDGTYASRAYMAQVQGLTSGVTNISTGFGYSCAVTAAGAVKCWGSNSDGVLGSSVSNTAVPTQVTGLTSGASQVIAAMYNTCAVMSTGTAKCWGWNGNGELGNVSTEDSATPVDVRAY